MKSLTGTLLSDVHFNPLADSGLYQRLLNANLDDWDSILSPVTYPDPKYNSDINYRFLCDTLDAAACGQPDGMVVVTGDLLCHNMPGLYQSLSGDKGQYEEFAKKTAIYVVRKIQGAFPHNTVIFALGNNDSAYGDYQLKYNDPMYEALIDEIKVLQPTASDDKSAARRSFRYGGYYSIPDPVVADRDIVVLNTVLWSPKNNTYQSNPIEIETQYHWLQEVLERAKTSAKPRKVCLVMHMSMGIDVYATKRDPKHPAAVWRPRETEKFLGLMAAYRDTVVVSFAGHTHMDDFRVVTDAASGAYLPIRITPAVSPYFGNNPGMSRFTYLADSGDVLDIETWEYDIAATHKSWEFEYSFVKAYSADGYNAASLSALNSTLATSDGKGVDFEKFSQYFEVSATPSPIQPNNYLEYICAQTNFSSNPYITCRGGG